MTDEKQRWCASGNHFVAHSKFKSYGGAIARDCEACRAKTKAPMLGVDIDAIHYKLGAVRKR